MFGQGVADAAIALELQKIENVQKSEVSRIFLICIGQKIVALRGRAGGDMNVGFVLPCSESAVNLLCAEDSEAIRVCRRYPFRVTSLNLSPRAAAAGP